MVIFEEATKEAFGYYPSELRPKSNKPILAACDDCGKIRETKKCVYHALCKSCVKKGKKNPMFGKNHTKRTKALIRAAVTGEKNSMFGKDFTEEHRANLSAAKKGNKNGYKDGKKASSARSRAKRKQLGYTIIISLGEGEVGHHFTDEDVIGIPKEVHETLGGPKRNKHRALVLEWLKQNDTKKYCLVASFLK